MVLPTVASVAPLALAMYICTLSMLLRVAVVVVQRYQPLPSETMLVSPTRLSLVPMTPFARSNQTLRLVMAPPADTAIRIHGLPVPALAQIENEWLAAGQLVTD
jgi:hypothetical protein